MAKKVRRGLVQQHLEDVSWKILKDYSRVVGELIRGRAGIYALYKGKRLYYVGLAGNLMLRLKQHLKDRHHSAWDRLSVYLTPQGSHLKELESFFLRIAKPTGNKVKGKFSGSSNLKAALSKRIKELEADRHAMLLGGAIAKRRRKSKAKRHVGSEALTGMVERRTVLEAAFKGRLYRAYLRKDGYIYYRKQQFSSPSAAAKAVTKRATNGWTFWMYKNEAGKWQRLSRLRA